MKAIIDFIKEIGVFPIKALGWMILSLGILMFIPQLNYIPKVVLLYILTPLVMGR